MDGNTGNNVLALNNKSSQIVPNRCQARKEKIMICTNSVIEKLKNRRKVFYSEADFQHALAWEIHENFPDFKIRLEYNPNENRYIGTQHIDIFVQGKNKKLAIEVKYKTKNATYICDNECFVLCNQSANDCGRYDYCYDIKRLELLKEYDYHGIAIFLTNDSAYYLNRIRNQEANDFEFRIHEGSRLSGILNWNEKTGSGTKKNREEGISLLNEYEIRWHNYSSLKNKETGNVEEFKYAFVEV